MSDRMNSWTNSPAISRRVAPALFCLVAIAACLSYAFIRHHLTGWWRENAGGVPYVVFWIALWFTVFPYRRCALPISIFAVAFTCVLEFLQLWQPEWLLRIRATRFGAALLGSGFAWHDFLPYFIGGILGYVAVRFLSARDETPHPRPTESH